MHFELNGISSLMVIIYIPNNKIPISIQLQDRSDKYEDYNKLQRQCNSNKIHFSSCIQ